MSRIPEFLETLEKMKQLHIKKNEDYATSDNPFDNFDFSEYVISRFANPRDVCFVWPISTKLARLANLLSNNSTPNNESIEDSLEDIAIYCILWKCDIGRRKKR